MGQRDHPEEFQFFNELKTFKIDFAKSLDEKKVCK